MEVKVTLQEIVITERQTNKQFIVRTIRTAKEIAEYIDESEKESLVARLEEVVRGRLEIHSTTILTCADFAFLRVYGRSWSCGGAR